MNAEGGRRKAEVGSLASSPERRGSAWRAASAGTSEAPKLNGRLVNGKRLLEALFAADCRPTERWLRTMMRARVIPHVRIGHLVFFDVEMVRAALARKNLVKGRH